MYRFSGWSALAGKTFLHVPNLTFNLLCRCSPNTALFPIVALAQSVDRPDLRLTPHATELFPIGHNLYNL